MQPVSMNDDWNDDPPPYSATTEASHEGRKDEVGFRKKYATSIPGIMKIIQIGLSFIGFILSVVASFGGVGFVTWVCISAFITTTILFVILAFNIYTRLPGFWPLYEMIFLMLYTLKYLIATIIAAVGSVISPTGMVACVICAVAFGIYLLDGVMSYRRFKQAKAEQERQASIEGNTEKISYCIIF